MFGSLQNTSIKWQEIEEACWLAKQRDFWKDVQQIMVIKEWNEWRRMKMYQKISKIRLDGLFLADISNKLLQYLMVMEWRLNLQTVIFRSRSLCRGAANFVEPIKDRSWLHVASLMHVTGKSMLEMNDYNQKTRKKKKKNHLVIPQWGNLQCESF